MNDTLRQPGPAHDAPILRVAAVYMRGGTSKGVFFRLQDLPAPCRAAGAARDRFLSRVIGSPDPYGKQIDGMGGATSSTSKAVIVSRSERPGHDVDYLFGQVAIDADLVDWSGNCGNLSAAVGGFSIGAGLVDASRIPRDGHCVVRIWQANIGKTIVAHVPVRDGQVEELGDFELDGVQFPAAEVRLDFLDPGTDAADAAAAGAARGGGLLPTGRVVDRLAVPGVGTLDATLIDAGIPMIFVDAAALGYAGTELQDAINGDAAALERLEAVRAHGALRMGLVDRVEDAARRRHSPKLAFVAPPRTYTSSSGRTVRADEIDLLVRGVSMGRLHHAMMGTAAVALATAAAIPGTLVTRAAGGAPRESIRFGHPSGTLRVGALARQVDGRWQVDKVSMSRSARVLMEGWVRVPALSLAGSIG
ncbi:MAG: 2-methylaconitate cis-trans isomerase PrpF [Lautropia sp.]